MYMPEHESFHALRPGNGQIYAVLKQIALGFGSMEMLLLWPRPKPRWIVDPANQHVAEALVIRDRLINLRALQAV